MELRGATIRKDGCMEIRLQLDREGSDKLEELCSGGIQPHDFLAALINLARVGSLNTANFRKLEVSASNQYIPGIVDDQGLLIPIEIFTPMYVACGDTQQAFEKIVTAVTGDNKVCKVYQRVVNDRGDMLKVWSAT